MHILLQAIDQVVTMQVRKIFHLWNVLQIFIPCLVTGNRGNLYRRYISRMHQLEKEREERKRVRREQREEERKRQRVLAEEEALKTPQQTSFLKDLLEVGGSGDSHSSQARSGH